MTTESNIINAIADQAAKREDIAVLYNACMNVPFDQMPWSKINRAIMDRWSESGLIWIKRTAHKLHQFQQKQESRP